MEPEFSSYASQESSRGPYPTPGYSCRHLYAHFAQGTIY